MPLKYGNCVFKEKNVNSIAIAVQSNRLVEKTIDKLDNLFMVQDRKRYVLSSENSALICTFLHSFSS